MNQTNHSNCCRERETLRAINFAIQENKVTIDCENHVIRQELTMDDTSSVMEYLTIYLERIQMCEAAAEVLGQRFELYINGSPVNNHKEG